MAKLKILALGAALAGGLAACSGTPVIGHTYVSDNYSPGILTYAAGRGGMLTEVTGNPFAGPKAALDSRVTESFEHAHFGPELPFFTEPPADYRSAYRVVVLFNPAPHANGAKLCSSPERPQADPQARPEGRVGVLAAFCTSDRRISSAGGTIAGATGPDDPSFQTFMRQLSLQLFPPQSPNKNDRDSLFTS